MILSSLFLLVALSAHTASLGLPDTLGHRPRVWVPPSPPSDTAQSAYWVFFTDKGVENVDELRDRCRALLPWLAKAGRKRTPDVYDLPVNSAYVDRVLEGGARLRQVSRWLNAVSVEAGVRERQTWPALPFVASVRKVARGRRVETSPSLPRAPEWKAASYPLDYGLSLLQLLPLAVPELHALELSAEGVLVAVFDSGFRLTHHAFDPLTGSGRLQGKWDFVQGDSGVANNSLDVPGQDFHGTEVLSTMTGQAQAELFGPALSASFLLAKTEDIGSETPIEEDHYVAALEWADSLGARIISSSLSYDFGYVMDGTQGISTLAANMAASRGMLLVTAMGNEGPGPTSLGAPADAFDIISVGAVDATGQIANFSSRGPTDDGRIKPEVVAQGVSDYAVDPSSVDGFVTVSGTSFATPIVAACAALLFEAHPDWSPLQVRDALMQSADRSGNPDNNYGWGRPQLLAALDFQPAGALEITPHLYDAYDAAPWRLSVNVRAGSGGRVQSAVAFYELLPGTSDSIALVSQGDTLWEADLAYASEQELLWRVRVQDSAGQVTCYPPDPHRRLRMLRLPSAFSDDFEGGGLRWIRGGTHRLWWPTAAERYAGGFSLTDSPGGGYPDLASAWIETALPIIVGPDLPWSINLVTRYQFAAGDSGFVEWRPRHDSLWQRLATYTGSQPDWQAQSYVLTCAAGDSLAVRFRLVSDFAITGDGWYIDQVYVGGLPLAVADETPASKGALVLWPSPNPFNLSTRLGFQLDRPTSVALYVYDLLGRRVRRLWDGVLASGPHSFEWDGRDDRGAALASGVYLVRLEADGQPHTRKLILLK